MASATAASAISATALITPKAAPAGIAALRPAKLSGGAARSARAASRLQVRASMKERAVTGLTAAALAAALVVPDIAEAAQPNLSPSLKNFLLSIGSGGLVLVVILGAVIAVSNFDPVKRS